MTTTIGTQAHAAVEKYQRQTQPAEPEVLTAAFRAMVEAQGAPALLSDHIAVLQMAAPAAVEAVLAVAERTVMAELAFDIEAHEGVRAAFAMLRRP